LAQRGGDPVILAATTLIAVTDPVIDGPIGSAHAFTLTSALAGQPLLMAGPESVAAEFGRLDIVVSNTGITHWGTVASTAVADFDRLVAVDARAPFLLMQAAADTLADGGRIVNISSGVTAAAVPGIALYSGAKAFLDQVTRVAAIEFAARGITVNAVGPGCSGRTRCRGSRCRRGTNGRSRAGSEAAEAPGPDRESGWLGRSLLGTFSHITVRYPAPEVPGATGSGTDV
jgi:NAD(P)-dependent dehydrogenase (short-subunit alcohol dehydrogenase family)